MSKHTNMKKAQGLHMESECWTAYETLHYFNQIKKATVSSNTSHLQFSRPLCNLKGSLTALTNASSDVPPKIKQPTLKDSPPQSDL